MKVFKLANEYLDTPVAIALGFFDCIHTGHGLLVCTAKEYAASNGFESALFTFCNDPSELLGGEKQIYDFKERAAALENLGLDNLVYADFDGNFAALTPEEFLNLLTDNLNVKAIITGADYTYGKKARGNVKTLEEFCLDRGIELIIKPFMTVNGRKISTSDLKNFVKNGDIATLNSLLCEPYFMIGEVERARGVGKTLGFPTANICVADGKLPLADGVYATVLYADNKAYASMTNVGAKPTFDVKSFSIEANILDFAGDLYGKTVKLSFVSRLRDVKKFESADALKRQLAYDEAQVRKIIKL